jgi:hypothetical protein
VAASSSPGDRPPNILQVVIDCARAKSVSVGGGNPAARTPHLDALAQRGTVFRRAVAPANWTVPSHMSFFVGRYPFEHRVRTFVRGEPPAETAAQALSRAGYRTALFTEMVHLISGYGLEAGFERKVSPTVSQTDEERTMANALASRMGFLYGASVRHLIGEVPPFVVPLNAFNYPQEVAYKESVCGPYLPPAFEQFLDSGGSDGRPFYAFFNFVDGHEPYPEAEQSVYSRIGPLARWYARTPRFYLLSIEELKRVAPWPAIEAAYRVALEAADRKLGMLLAALERRHELDRTMVVVLSDHGQSFGEGGNVYHGCGSTESVTRVPLVVAPPAGMSLPPAVDPWVSLVELPGWFSAVAAGHVPFGPGGRAPAGYSPPDGGTVYCEGGPASDPNRSLVGIGTDRPWNRRQIAAYQEDRKYVLDLATDELWAYAPADDFDRVTPERLSGDRARDVRRDVFRRFEDATRQGAAPASTARTPGRAETVDARLRSWGYD